MAAVPETRTKYKAMARGMAREGAAMLGKDPEAADAALPQDWLNAIAWSATSNPTTPTRMDRRFPNVNQNNNCWTAFNEYQLCVDKRGKSDLLCMQRGRDYTAICPAKVVETWKGHAESGVSMSVGTAYLKE